MSQNLEEVNKKSAKNIAEQRMLLLSD